MTASGTTWRARAPVRLDFAGGWTDVAPFASREGGTVVNAAIDRYAIAEIALAGDGYRLCCADSGEHSTLHDGRWQPEERGALEFHKAALRRTTVPHCTVTTRSMVPRGSGLGGSGALGVAMVAAFDAATGIARPAAAVAEEAFQVEAVDAAMPGGRQDQYAAALGGIHRLRFHDGQVVAERLALDPAFAAVLLDHTIVCYTGVSRTSGRTIARVMSAYEDGVPQVVDALRAMTEVADRMAEALTEGDLVRTGLLLSANWRHQQALDHQMQTPEMAALEHAMQDAGLLGAKAAGSGAGGSIFFLVRDRAAAIHAATRCGAVVLPFGWSDAGVQVEAV